MISIDRAGQRKGQRFRHSLVHDDSAQSLPRLTDATVGLAGNQPE